VNRTAPLPIRRLVASSWFILLATLGLSLLATSSPASPVREPSRGSLSSTVSPLRSLEVQESPARLPETRIRGFELSSPGAQRPEQRLKKEQLWVLGCIYGVKALGDLVLQGDPVGMGSEPPRVLREQSDQLDRSVGVESQQKHLEQGWKLPRQLNIWSFGRTRRHRCRRGTWHRSGRSCWKPFWRLGGWWPGRSDRY